MKFYAGLQKSINTRDAAVQCDLPAERPLMIDAGIQCKRLCAPVSSSPVIVQSESEVSDLENPRDTSFHALSPESTSS